MGYQILVKKGSILDFRDTKHEVNVGMADKNDSHGPFDAYIAATNPHQSVDGPLLEAHLIGVPSEEAWHV